MMADQNYACAICGESIRGRAHVDHNHKTDEVRGLLCFLCNAGLGMFKDNIRLLAAAIVYLERSVDQ